MGINDGGVYDDRSKIVVSPTLIQLAVKRIFLALGAIIGLQHLAKAEEI